MKYIFCLLSFFCLTVSAQEIQFTAEVNPASVPKGEAFNLTYTLNAAGSNLRLPSLPDFDVLTPQPSTGRSSFSSNINGAWQESTTYTYRYTLRSKKEGTFTIPVATVTVGGKQYSSNTVTMRVGGQAQSSTGSSQSSGLEAYEDIFMRLMPSKTTVYEQEAIFLNYKLFSAKGNFIRWGNNVKFPDTKGFIAQEIELDANAQWMPETYNGKQYLAVSAKQQILQAQQAGTLEIGKGSFEALEARCGEAETFAIRCGAPVIGWRRIMTSVPITSSVRAVSISVSPFATLEVEAAMLEADPDMNLHASSNDRRVRVLFS